MLPMQTQHVPVQASFIALCLGSVPGRAQRMIIDITVMSRGPRHPPGRGSQATVQMSGAVQCQESWDAKVGYVTGWGAGQTTVPRHALITPFNNRDDVMLPFLKTLGMATLK